MDIKEIEFIKDGIEKMLTTHENRIDEGYRIQIDEYLNGERFEFDIDEKIFENTPNFTKAVLKECFKIPYGEVITYSQLASRAGNSKAYRAVGNIMNKNKYPVIIPCHRVVGSNNSLVGYAGGVKLKEKLLKLEREYRKNKRG